MRAIQYYFETRVRYTLALSILFFAGFQQLSFSQNWSKGLKATGSSQSLYKDADIAIDAKGSMVIAGNYNNSISFGYLSINTDNTSYSDIFLCRIGSDHVVQWLKHIEAGFNYGDYISLSIDDDKNIYLTGMKNSLIFVSKYDSTGQTIWSIGLGEKAFGYGTGIKTDVYGNVYVSGGSGWEFFMAKISATGNIIWKKSIGVNSSAGCLVTDIEVDALGNIYFAGNFGIDLPLDKITLKYTLSYGPSVFWGKMDSRGNFIWAKSAIGRSTEKISLALTSDGHIFLTGGVAGSVLNFDGLQVSRGNCCQGATAFIVKSDVNGVLKWAKSGNDTYYGSMPQDIEVDYSSNLYLTGSFFTCYGSFCTESDFYIEKYDKDGTSQWRTTYASGDSESPKAIDIDNNGLLYLLGVNSSPTFIDQNAWSPSRTYGVGIFDTKSSTYKRTPRPFTQGLISICDEQKSPYPPLQAKGNNIRWYGNASLTEKLADGTEYKFDITTTDTFYVTQTVASIESWPKPVIVRFSSIPKGDLVVRNDSIHAPTGSEISYQWLYNGKQIKNANQNYVVVDTTKTFGSFSVIVSDGNCQKLLNRITVITSIENEEYDTQVICYPNPTSSFIYIQSPRGRPTLSAVLIRNSL